MADINEVYGNNFQEKSIGEKAAYAAKLFASNIVHKQFSFRNDSASMWLQNNMKSEAVATLIAQVKANNPLFRLVHVSKTSNKINGFPYLINGAVEYFIVVELEKNQMYSIYITPQLMEAY